MHDLILHSHSMWLCRILAARFRSYSINTGLQTCPMSGKIESENRSVILFSPPRRMCHHPTGIFMPLRAATPPIQIVMRYSYKDGLVLEIKQKAS